MNPTPLTPNPMHASRGSSAAVSSVLKQSDAVIVKASSAGATPKGAAQAKMVQELNKNILAAASEAGVTVEEHEVPHPNQP